MLSKLAAAAIWFTTPSFGVDTLSSDCAQEDSSIVQNIVAARLYRALCHTSGMPIFIRQKNTVRAHRDSFEVDTATCATFWITAVNAGGLESCHGNGLTVGIPPVGVGPGTPCDDSEPGEDGSEWFDLRGARINPPPSASGVYFVRERRPCGRAAVRLIRIVR